MSSFAVIASVAVVLMGLPILVMLALDAGAGRYPVTTLPTDDGSQPR